MELQKIENGIHEIREENVMPYFDVADMCGNQCSKASSSKKYGAISNDFLFGISKEEFEVL